MVRGIDGTTWIPVLKPRPANLFILLQNNVGHAHIRQPLAGDQPAWPSANDDHGWRRSLTSPINTPILKPHLFAQHEVVFRRDRLTQTGGNHALHQRLTGVMNRWGEGFGSQQVQRRRFQMPLRLNAEACIEIRNQVDIALRGKGRQ